MKNIQGKVAVITGAGSGIGRALAICLAHEGCHLAISDMNMEGLEKTKKLTAYSTVQVRSYYLDVADKEAVYAHADDVERDFGQVNLIFNNAGVALSSKLVDIDIKDFEWLMNIDFWGVVYGTQAFLPKLITSGEGYIINISSIFGMISVPKQGAYNAAKFAVRGYTEALRQELMMDALPVGVSCVHPGGIKTDIARNARIGPGEDHAQIDNHFDKFARTTPNKAAQIILKGIKRNKSRIIIGTDAHVIHFMYRLLGAKYQAVTQFIAKKTFF